MKTKIFKSLMPMMVFMLAIVFAFASTSSSEVKDLTQAPIPGYIYQNNKCVQVTTCSLDFGPLCMVGETPARNKISDTQCGLQNLYQRSK
ncbi:MAG: DUF6520 family protein [Gelidibacter sp.]